MGAVDFSIDIRLVDALRRALPLTAFVETGTFEGEAIARVHDLFAEIHSIELSDHYYAQASSRFAADPHVSLYHGDSTRGLESLRPAIEEKSVLYWLDAHWCVANATAGESSQCPLLDELTALRRLNATSVVLIDDARLFLATPPDPHEVSAWPRFHEVLERLQALSASHQIMVVNDVILFFPAAALPAVSEYARSNGIDWLEELHQRRELERERNLLAGVAEERLDAIHSLTRAAEERLAALEACDRERQALAQIAQERLERLNKLAGLPPAAASDLGRGHRP